MPPRKAKQPLPEFIEEGDGGRFQCSICASTVKSWVEHIKGTKHKRNVEIAHEGDRARTELDELYREANAAQMEPVDDIIPPDEPRFDITLGDSSFAALDVNETFAPTAADLAAAQEWMEAGRGESVPDYLARLESAVERLILDPSWLHIEDGIADDDLGLANDIGNGDSDDDGSESGEDMAIDGPAYDRYMALKSGNEDWFPYPNKTVLLVDILTSLPRLRLSDAQIRMILWVMRETGCRDVPTLSSLKRLKKQLRVNCAASTIQHTSELGNVFFTNSAREIFAMEMANPQVAKEIRFYPELRASSISEGWETSRWLTFPPSYLTPMVRVGSQSFFVNELAERLDGSFVLPSMWHTCEGTLCGKSYSCTVNNVTGLLHVNLHDEIHVPVHTLARSFEHITSDGVLPTFDAPSSALREQMPNSLRKKADGLELFTIFVNAWADDVSGNVSKQYNKHWNVCLANAGLPSTLLGQEYFVRFYSTSPHASAPEQLAALQKEVMSTHDEPQLCYNAATGRMCKIRLVVQSLPGDNPQQSENCSHMTGNANLNCRRCWNRRNAPKDDASDSLAWYTDNYKVGRLRVVDETLATVQNQLDMACCGKKSAADDIKANQTATGVKDAVAQAWIEKLLAKAAEMRAASLKSPSDRAIPHTEDDIAKALKSWLDSQPGDHLHPLLHWSGLDPHQDTPVEILHTILLGLVKYVWHGLHSSWKPEQEALFVVRLQSTDTRGLSIPPLRASYIMQYKNNLIGKHFKTLSQTLAFHMHNISTPEQFTLIKACGELCPVLWYPQIDDMPTYLANLRILINNVLDAYAAIDATRILVKVKLHLLEHLPDDIPRYGPAIRFATEIFECFNAVFRFCSVLSNHQAPSRDIAMALADIDRLKHIVSGGSWESEGRYVHAGKNVTDVLRNHPIVQRHLGWAPPSQLRAGTVKPVARKRAAPRPLSSSEADALRLALPAGHRHLESLPGFRRVDGVHVVSQSGDVCELGSWIVYKAADATAHIGRVDTIHIPEFSSADAKAFIMIQEYFVGTGRHPDFGMPFLTARAVTYTCIMPEDVQFIINVQHDCRSSGCGPTGTRNILQERMATTRTVPVIEHVQNERYIINTHAFHNAAALRKALPANLTDPIPLHADNARGEWLLKTGATAKAQALEKARITQEKRKLTMEQKRAKKGRMGEAPAAEGGQDREDEPIDGDEAEPEERPEKRRRVRR